MVLSFLRNLFNTIKVGIITEILPEYKTDGAACFDLCVISGHTLHNNELFNFRTGVKCKIPKGWCMLIFPRSSLGQKKILIPNSVGVIDSDYRGEIKIPILSLNNEEIDIPAGTRIAQGMLIPVKHARFIRCKTLSDTLRGDGGFGSTGNI